MKCSFSGRNGSTARSSTAAASCSAAAISHSQNWHKQRVLPSKSDDSPIMKEFRKNHLQFELEDIRTHMLEFAKDQFGSRFIQKKLESVDGDDKHMVFAEITPEIVSLMNHKYANYVVQKFFEFGSDDQKIVLVEKLQGNVLFLTMEVYGCRVIQKAIETLPPEFQVGHKIIVVKLKIIIFNNNYYTKLMCSLCMCCCTDIL